MRSVELEQVKEEMSMYEQEVISAERATMVLEEKCAAFEAQRDRVMRLYDSTMDQLQKASVRQSEAESQTAKVREQKAAVQDELSCLRGGEMAQQILQLQARLREVTDGIWTQEHGQLAELRARATAAENERDQLDIELAKTQKLVDALQSGEIAQLQMKIHDAEEEQQEVQDDLNQTNAHITQLKLQLQALEKKQGKDDPNAAKKAGEGPSKLSNILNKKQAA